jgi:hypothetical protein
MVSRIHHVVERVLGVSHAFGGGTSLARHIAEQRRLQSMWSLARLSLALLAVSVCARPAIAEPSRIHPAAPRPAWAIRGNAAATLIDATTLGADLSWWASRLWGVEAELGTASMSDGTEDAVDVSVLGRFGFIGRHHGFTLGLGPRFLLADSYGPVAAAQTEVAYEYRHSGGISLLLGLGPTIALNSSRPGNCSPAPFLTFCREQYHPGDASFRLRAALGYSF